MKKIFKGKKVLITGHTGFKGSWLTLWLYSLGAKIIGISDNIPYKNSHFSLLNIKNKISHNLEDIRNYKKIEKIILKTKPDFIFHLAAQSLVQKSYNYTLDTWEVNLMGTVNMLEVLKKIKNNCTAIFVTSDKCYFNAEQAWGYRENDKLGGKDPYSGSKGSAELAIFSYFNSFFKNSKKIRIGIGRAGNVIGGGDWAEGRIVPDCMRSVIKNKNVILRNPNSTRPWQHVLEPLSGYLSLASNLSKSKKLNGEAFNFGPQLDQNFNVKELVIEMKKNWSNVKWKISATNKKKYEASLLKLNFDKALHYLDWKPVWNFNETSFFTSNWYKNFFQNKKKNIYKYSLSQLNLFIKKAKEKKLKWAQ